jgi:hypothetical protein
MRLRVERPGGGSFELDDGRLEPYRRALERLPAAPRTRLAYAATRVVMRDEYATVRHAPDASGASGDIAHYVDWQATLEQRRRLDRLGFGIAEAMDTAQRFALGWPLAERLIAQCGRAGLRNGFIAGAAADHLPGEPGLQELVGGVVHQCGVIQRAGGMAIVLPLLPLARRGADAATYVRVYDEIIAQSAGPLWIHWLGRQFLPELAGYFPHDSFERVMALDPGKVRGAKLSLLDPRREVELRRRLLERDQLVLTGDDLHFGRLLLGGDPDGATPRASAVLRTTRIGARDVALGDFSHALLGVLDAVAEPVGLALDLLARGDEARAAELLAACEELGCCLFEPPTSGYRAGLAFLAWLDGRQSNRLLANHEERARSRDHLWRAAELASRAGVITDAEWAAERLRSLISGPRG